jgi:hypothetical protein
MPQLFRSSSLLYNGIPKEKRNLIQVHKEKMPTLSGVILMARSSRQCNEEENNVTKQERKKERKKNSKK